MKTVATWGIVAVVVIGMLLSILVRKILAKILCLLVAAVLVYLGWQQRQKVVEYADEVRGKACSAADDAAQNATPERATTFLGLPVSMPTGWCS